jgi:hypothetical protein
MGRPKHALKVPYFFSSYVLGWEGEGEIFFHFSQLPNVFTLCSFQVPNGFPIFFAIFFSIPPHFYMPWKMVSSFHLYRWAKGRNCTVQNRTFCFGESLLFYFIWNDGWANQIGMLPKKNLGGTSFN